jgi:catechol 2,3-dioxygenase-like lactoylglutathione lyase family enzyme
VRPRFLKSFVAVCLAAWCAALCSPSRAEDPAAPTAVAVGPIGITVSDLDRAVEFYTTVLGFERLAEEERAGEAEEHLFGLFGVRRRTATLQLGMESIELTEFLAASTGEGRPIPLDSRSHDRWFQHIAIVVRDIDEAYAHLRRHRVRHASTGPQTLPAWNPDAGGISAFYFKDPDRHVLEVIHFPPGKGDPRWRQPSDRLFLGIDHTAIVVADTQRSLAFYRDVLGLHVVGGAENFGTEQEHLNNVFGARLRITALGARSGPGVEFLEYLAPSDGRPFPPDARQNDLVAWRTVVRVAEVDHVAGEARTAGGRWVSQGAVPRGDGESARIVLDPDGHAVMLCGSPGETPVSRATTEAQP